MSEVSTRSGPQPRRARAELVRVTTLEARPVMTRTSSSWGSASTAGSSCVLKPSIWSLGVLVGLGVAGSRADCFVVMPRGMRSAWGCAFLAAVGAGLAVAAAGGTVSFR